MEQPSAQSVDYAGTGGDNDSQLGCSGPLFVLTYNQSIPNGYDAEGLYRLEVTRNKADTLSVPARDFERIMQGLRHHKDIESATCVLSGAIPVLRVII